MRTRKQDAPAPFVGESDGGLLRSSGGPPPIRRLHKLQPSAAGVPRVLRRQCDWRPRKLQRELGRRNGEEKKGEGGFHLVEQKERGFGARALPAFLFDVVVKVIGRTHDRPVAEAPGLALFRGFVAARATVKITTVSMVNWTLCLRVDPTGVRVFVCWQLLSCLRLTGRAARFECALWLPLCQLLCLS